MLKTMHDGKSVVFHLSRPGDALYARAAGLAKTVYKASYDATIDPAPATFLVCDEGVRADIVACAGLSFGGDRRLFSEQYLDVDLELALDGVFGYPVKRDKAVEVTSLATITPNAGSELVKIIPILCWYWGMKAILCTATTRLQALLRHHKLPFAALAAAHPGKLGPTAEGDWGSYYDCNPTTGIIRLDRIGELFQLHCGKYAPFDVANLTDASGRRPASEAGVAAI